MPGSVHYAITNLLSAVSQHNSSEPFVLWPRLEQELARWIHDRVAFIQLREKLVDGRDLYGLAVKASAMLHAVPPGGVRPKLLINGRIDIAIASKAEGVHLTSRPGELHPDQVRLLFRRAGLPSPIVSVSCHTLAEVATARDQGADLLLFGPTFEKHIAGKRVVEGTGLPSLAAACSLAAPVKVLALGGVALADEVSCLAAGAAGVAGIRLFSA